jgi:hypothetical protein
MRFNGFLAVPIAMAASAGCTKFKLDLASEVTKEGMVITATCARVGEIRARNAEADCSSGHARLVVPFADLGQPSAEGRGWTVSVCYTFREDERSCDNIDVKPWELPEGSIARKNANPGQLPLTGPEGAFLASDRVWEKDGLGVDGMFGAGKLSSNPHRRGGLYIHAQPGSRIEVAGRQAKYNSAWKRFELTLVIADLLPYARAAALVANPPFISVPASFTAPGGPTRTGVLEVRDKHLALNHELAELFKPLGQRRALELPPSAHPTGRLLFLPGGIAYRPSNRSNDPSRIDPSRTFVLAGSPERIADIREVAFGRWAPDRKVKGFCRYKSSFSHSPWDTGRKLPRGVQDLEITVHDARSGAELRKARIAGVSGCPSMLPAGSSRAVTTVRARDIEAWVSRYP